ncbi:uncharacterized protein LOC135924630 isoform X2 [Gordionus sp. m RMFG-2023]
MENSTGSSSSLEEINLQEKRKISTKKHTNITKLCSICLVFLLFLSLILSLTIIFMHLETKQEINNLASRFKYIEIKNLEMLKDTNNFKTKVLNLTYLNSDKKFGDQNYSKNIDLSKIIQKKQNLQIMKSLMLLGSDLGKLKADISEIKDSFGRYKSGYWKPMNPHGKLGPDQSSMSLLGKSEVWNISKINSTAKTITDHSSIIDK